MTKSEIEKIVTDYTNEIHNQLLEQITDFLESKKISQAEYARILGCSRAYISQLYNQEWDHKLSKLILLSIAIGKLPVITFKDIPSYYLNLPASQFTINPSVIPNTHH